MRLLEQDLALGESQLYALDRRISILKEERDRNADIRTLVRLGGTVSASHMSDHNCPTCQQSLDAVEARELGPVLDVDETVKLLNAQVSTTEKMRERARLAIDQSSSAYSAMQNRADELRTIVRAFESDTLSANTTPSAGDIAQRISLELRYSEIERTRNRVGELLDELVQTAGEAVQIKLELDSLPTGVPSSDATKIDLIVSNMRNRLSASNFRSYNIGDVGLNSDSLLPGRSGFDIDTDVSASDVVRIKIAYLDSIRVVGREIGRHPSLLILDAPKQQDIASSDYSSILQYLAQSSTDGSQTIITAGGLTGDALKKGHFVDIGETRLLQPVGETDPLDL